jgi:hypothetical protein
MVEQIQDYQTKWHNCVGKRHLKFLRGKQNFITLLEDGTMDVQEEDGHNNSFSHGRGRDTILKSAEEEEKECLSTFSQIVV